MNGETKYLVPDSLQEACDMLTKEKNGAVLAGGTDLLVKTLDNEFPEVSFISLKHLGSMKSIIKENNALIIGAGVTLSEIEHDPLIRKMVPVLSKTAANMASPQIRNVATIGGNLCNAAPSADLAPPLLVMDATVKITSASGSRTENLDEFFKGPGLTVLARGEILESIHIPIPIDGSAYYIKCARRVEMDIATVGVAISGLYNKKHSAFEKIKIAYGAVAPVPLRAYKLENMLVNNKLTDELIEEAAESSTDIISPISNIRSSADYRRTLIKVYTKKLLKNLISPSEESEEV